MDVFLTHLLLQKLLSKSKQSLEFYIWKKQRESRFIQGPNSYIFFIIPLNFIKSFLTWFNWFLDWECELSFFTCNKKNPNCKISCELSPRIGRRWVIRKWRLMRARGGQDEVHLSWDLRDGLSQLKSPEIGSSWPIRASYKILFCRLRTCSNIFLICLYSTHGPFHTMCLLTSSPVIKIKALKLTSPQFTLVMWWQVIAHTTTCSDRNEENIWNS